jgi:hypothetical protein
MTDPDPPPARAAATDPAEPVTVADIAAFTARLARLRPPALGGDPAEHAALCWASESSCTATDGESSTSAPTPRSPISSTLSPRSVATS